MICKECKDEVDELVPVKVNGRTRKLCETCVEMLEEQGEIAAGALDAMREMMEYKGR